MRHSSRTVLGVALVLAGTMVVACGSSSNPASPGSPSPASSTSGAIVQGTVLGGASSVRSADSTGDSMTVTVVGTNIVVTVSGTGQFTLTGVPAGDVTLKFHGKNGEALLQLLQLMQGETITITVTVQGTTATEETETRVAGDNLQAEGRIESINTTAKTFLVAGKTIATDGSTTLRHGSTAYDFEDLEVGWRVHVAGAPSTGGILARTIEVQNTNGALPLNLNGTVSAMTGTATDFQFKVDGQLVKGDALTVFSGKNGSFANLKDGVRVEVKGKQQNGYVYAKSIKMN